MLNRCQQIALSAHSTHTQHIEWPCWNNIRIPVECEEDFTEHPLCVSVLCRVSESGKWQINRFTFRLKPIYFMHITSENARNSVRYYIFVQYHDQTALKV